MAGEKILVIEDERDILEVLEYNLTREGFSVTTSSDGVEGLDLAKNSHPDLILLDLMLPGLDGLEVCKRLKEVSATKSISVIMVTAKGEESDIVIGLGLGADDYVAKPFSPKELVGRVKAVLRRGPLKLPGTQKEKITRENFVIDSVKHEVRLDGKPVMFTATEFRILHFLASNPGRVFTRDEIISNGIGGDAFVVDRNIDVHIRSVRKKLERQKSLIETIRGIGYRFMDMAE